MCGKALMSSLYTYLRIILMVFINMAKNIGPDGDSAYFSAILVSLPIPAFTITGISS